MKAQDLGSKSFKQDHNCQYSYMAGSMACAISGAELVIAMGKKGFLASYGCGGVEFNKLEQDILKIKEALPNGPYVFNMLHVPGDHSREEKVINLYLRHNITTIEASAYIKLTKALVKFRVLGLYKTDSGEVVSRHKIIAKLSRKEIAERFMSAPPEEHLKSLLEAGEISKEQALLAKDILMADDITLEADSGGHTDGQPLISAFPSLVALRKQRACEKIRLGAAGGISTPQSISAAFAMGADYVVTGSINQSTLEAGTSRAVKELLSQAEMSDVTMAPASDMFEQGGKVQVLKKGTIYPLRANFLYTVFTESKSIDDISEKDLKKIEESLFRKPLSEVREEMETYLRENHPTRLQRIQQNPKRLMGAIFKWYLRYSSRWATSGEESRLLDMQVWCGPGMGAFNEWAKGGKFENAENRHVAQIAEALMEEGASLLGRYSR